MSITETVPRTSGPTVGFDDDLSHVVCCSDDDLSLCGLDVSDFDWDDGEDTDCIVCDELDDRQFATDSCIGCPLLCKRRTS